MYLLKTLSWLLTLLYFPISISLADELKQADQCMLQAIYTGDENKKIKDIKTECKSFLSSSRGMSKHNRFILAYKPNYVLPYTYNNLSYSTDLFQQQFNDTNLKLDRSEVHFQLSIKIPLMDNLFDKNIELFAAYTNRSFWQLFNDKISAPFRETNHEPEIWLQNKSAANFLGFNESVQILGVSHQSNGRGGILSRSWNRIYLQYILENTALVVSVKAWSRISEKREKDDNPDITNFLGHSELQFKYKLTKHVLSLLTRNNIESRFTKGAIELAWSFPLRRKNDIKGYLQVFSGYGESMISYNRRVERIGIGILISDWL